MKIYTFDSGGYTEQYHVLASSKEEALNYIKTYAINKDIERIKERMEMWSADKEYKFPAKYVSPNGIVWEYRSLEEYLNKDGYHYQNYLIYTNPNFSIEERGVGEVFQTEVS